MPDTGANIRCGERVTRKAIAAVCQHCGCVAMQDEQEQEEEQKQEKRRRTRK